MSRRRYLIINLLLFLSLVVQAATPVKQQLENANKTYQSKDYASAIQQYEQLLKEGYHSEALYYNLGNSYYRVGTLGKAILNYERTLLLDPYDADAKHNLAIARSRLQDKIETLPPFFLTQWWNNLALSMSTTTWSTLALTLLWLGMAGLAVWLLGQTRRGKKLGFIIGIILLILSLLSFLFARHRLQLENHNPHAVILQSEVAMHSAPDRQSASIIDLHEGTTVKLLDKIGDWYKVSLPNGDQGWLPMKSVERI